MKEITSIQNPFIKNLLILQEKAKERKKQGVFLIEGKREIELAKKGSNF
jgi:TrmH family RNA methyltransferase